MSGSTFERREILAVFLSMAAGLACGMGCVAVAAVFTLLICLVYAVLSRSRFGEEKNGDKHRTMNITVPESLEYAGAFDDIFKTYTESCRLVRVKTTGLGSLNRLTYDIIPPHRGGEGVHRRASLPKRESGDQSHTARRRGLRAVKKGGYRP